MKIRSAPWHLSRAAVTDRSMATKLFTQTLRKKSTNLAQTLCLVLSVSGAVLKLDQKFEKVRYAKLTASFACLGSKTWTKKVFENCCGFCDALKVAGEMFLHPFQRAWGFFQALSLPRTFSNCWGYFGEFAKAPAAKPGPKKFLKTAGAQQRGLK